MGFGKKKTSPVVKFDQSNVTMLASEALAKRRNTFVRCAFRLRGDTPLLMHRWGQKSIIQMLHKMVTGANLPRDNKDLTEDYEQSYYRNDRGEVCVPCRIIKAAIIEGAIATGGAVTKADLKRYLRVLGYTTPLRFAKGTAMQKDVRQPLTGALQMDVRIASNNGSPDLRARALVPAGYTMDIVLQFPPGSLSPDQVVAALESAGCAIGLCEMRPEKGGELGTFSVEVLTDKDIARILQDCSSPEDEYVIPPEYLKAFKGLRAGASDPVRKAMAVVSKVNGEARGRKKNGAAVPGDVS